MYSSSSQRDHELRLDTCTEHNSLEVVLNKIHNCQAARHAGCDYPIPSWPEESGRVWAHIFPSRKCRRGFGEEGEDVNELNLWNLRPATPKHKCFAFSFFFFFSRPRRLVFHPMKNIQKLCAKVDKKHYGQKLLRRATKRNQFKSAESNRFKWFVWEKWSGISDNVNDSAPTNDERRDRLKSRSAPARNALHGIYKLQRCSGVTDNDRHPKRRRIHWNQRALAKMFNFCIKFL